MNHTSNRRSSIFLTEMIIAILFFSLVSAMCLRIFAKSHELNETLHSRTMAVTQAQNAAELLKQSLSIKSPENSSDSASYRFWDSILKEYPYAETTGEESITVFYDDNWSHCPETNTCCYCMKILRTGEPRLFTFQIDILNQSAENLPPIYSLKLKLHYPN